MFNLTTKMILHTQLPDLRLSAGSVYRVKLFRVLYLGPGSFKDHMRPYRTVSLSTGKTHHMATQT